MRIAAALAILVCLSACGGTPEKEDLPEPEPVATGDYFIGTQNIYAQLVSGAGGSWIFTEVSRSEMQPANGYLVRLNDLTPVFDIRVAECTPQNYPPTHKCNPTHPFREKDVGVISKLISGGIAAGTAGKVTDISRTYETTFDEAKFNQAVDEALVNTGLNNSRHDFINALETYSTLLSDSRARLRSLEQKAKADFTDVRAVELRIQPELSGLTQYYFNDIEFGDLVELTPGPFKSSGKGKLGEDEVLPCDAHRCAQKARTAINSLRADLDLAENRLAETFDASKITYNVHCNKTAYKDYLLQVECPAEIARQEAGAIQLPLLVRILARDFVGLYPKMNLADDRLDIAISDDVVVFKNHSQDYLSVTAQTIYYNSRVETSTGTISVAPGESVVRPMSEFVTPSIEIESSFRQMTPAKAERTSFDFGFAAAYRASGGIAETTLYDMRTFNLGCVIDGQADPETCFSADTADVQARDQEQNLPMVPN